MTTQRKKRGIQKKTGKDGTHFLHYGCLNHERSKGLLQTAVERASQNTHRRHREEARGCAQYVHYLGAKIEYGGGGDAPPTCLISESEARKASYFLANFLMRFLFLLNFLRSSTDMRSRPICSAWLSSSRAENKPDESVGKVTR